MSAAAAVDILTDELPSQMASALTGTNSSISNLGVTCSVAAAPRTFSCVATYTLTTDVVPGSAVDAIVGKYAQRETASYDANGNFTWVGEGSPVAVGS